MYTYTQESTTHFLRVDNKAKRSDDEVMAEVYLDKRAWTARLNPYDYLGPFPSADAAYDAVLAVLHICDADRVRRCPTREYAAFARSEAMRAN